MLLEEDLPFPTPLLVAVLLLWLTTLNVTYGLFAPQNATILSVLIFCALPRALCSTWSLIRSATDDLDPGRQRKEREVVSIHVVAEIEYAREACAGRVFLGP